MVRSHCGRRNATRLNARTAFSVNTVSLFNVFDYCVSLTCVPAVFVSKSTVNMTISRSHRDVFREVSIQRCLCSTYILKKVSEETRRDRLTWKATEEAGR